MFWIGLKREEATVKWAKIRQLQKKISIDQLRTISLDEDVKPLYFTKETKEDGISTIISGLDTSEVLLRDVDLKIKDKRKILQSLPFQIESSIPFPSEEAVVAIQIFPEKNTTLSKVSLFVTKTTTLTSHIDLWKNLDIDPNEISCVPAALKRFAKHFFPELEKTIVFHIELKSSTVIYLEGDRILFSHSFPLGLEIFFNASEKDGEKSNTADFSKISSDDHPFLYEASLCMRREIDRVFSFLSNKNKTSCEDLILTGNFVAFPKFREFIAFYLPDPIKIKTCPGSDLYDSTTLEAYAIPIGLALDGLSNDGQSIEFRKDTFYSVAAKKRKVKAFLSFTIAVLTLTCSAFALENLYLEKKQKQLVENFNSSLDGEVIQSKSIKSVEQKLLALENRLKKNKTPYPLDPSLPSVSEILAWLSTIPSEPDAVEINKIKYDLVKHPKTGATKEPYVAKVSLELDAANPSDAEAFQKALSQEPSLVDLKKEFTMENHNSKYLISFFLKSTI